MSVPAIRIYGIPETLAAFGELPRRVQFKHLRIALSAGGGVVRDAYARNARRQTGLLSKSIGVKVTIPDSSFNAAHRGKPATAVVGVKRRAGRIMRFNSKGNLKGFGKAQAELKIARQLKQGVAIDRERESVRFVLASFKEAIYRNPSRYAHLAGKGRKGAAVLARAVAVSKNQALAAIERKLTAGIEQEARALAPAGG